MDILYKDIVTRINSQVAAVKWSGWDNGEIDLVENSYPIPFPCVLIDFPSYRPETVGQNVQNGNLLIRLRIAFRIYNDMQDIAPAASQASGLTILKTLNTIYAALQGWAGSNHYNELERIDQSRQQRDDDLTVYTMDFETGLRDAHASPTYVEKEDVTLVVERPADT